MSRLSTSVNNTALFIWIGIGGSIGACLRHAASFLHEDGTFPFSTLLVNLAGCFFLTYLTKKMVVSGFLSTRVKHAVTIGLLGSLTTFSAFSLEFFLLLEKETAQAFIYLIISIGGGILGSWLGYFTPEKKAVDK